MEKRDFNKEAASWDENPMKVKITTDIGDSVLAHLQLTDEMDVLDFGCGTGILSFMLAPQVKSITGADSAQGMLDVFSDKAEKLGIGNAKTKLVDVEKNGFLDGPYSLVTSSLAFHHIKDVAGLLIRIYDALRTSGMIAVADLDLDHGKFHEDPSGVYHNGFDRTEFGKLLTGAGFKEVRFFPATTITKPGSDGKMGTFSVFLATARK